MKNIHKNKQLIAVSAVAILLMAGTAAVASYMTREALQPQAESKTQAKQQPARVASAQPAQPRCNDNNIVGTVAGGAVGGILGNQVGKGSGKTAATIGGVLGGAYVGNQVIPTRNVTCRQ